MSDLAHWEAKIQEKRKQTPFREFVKEMASWESLNLYRLSDGKISRYPNRDRVKNIDDEEFQNPSKYFVDYNLESSFFANFQRLYDIMPFQHVMQFGYENENSDFADAIFGAKNAYLTFVSGFETENIAYSAFVYIRSKNVLNSFFVSSDVYNVYMSWGVTRSDHVFYSRYISDSSHIWFSSNLLGCRECIFCDGLQNQKFCIENVPYAENEYYARKKEILEDKRSFDARNVQIRKQKGKNLASQNVSGSYIVKCEDMESSGWTVGIRKARNTLIGIGEGDCENFLDCIDFGANAHDFYGCIAAGNSSQYVYCSTQIDQSSNIYYGYFLQNCSFCIGCIGLKNKSYCILNKQYTKEEWHALSDKIFASMEADGTLGKFFPGSMNPFYFNDTLAALVYGDFTKEEVTKEGYLWRDEAIRADIPEGAEIIESSDLDRFQWYDATWVWRIDPEIKKKVIRDTQGNCYRIVPMEYGFLMKHALPLPTIHWLDRIKMGFRV